MTAEKPLRFRSSLFPSHQPITSLYKVLRDDLPLLCPHTVGPPAERGFIIVVQTLSAHDCIVEENIKIYLIGVA